MHPDWARSLRDQCQAAGVPFMFKQWGEWAPNFPPCRAAGNAPLHWIDGDNYVMRVGKKAAGRLLDGRTWDEVPPVAAIGATS
jgi:protein gp37